MDTNTIAQSAAIVPPLLAAAEGRGLLLPFAITLGESGDVDASLYSPRSADPIHGWADMLGAEVTHGDPHEYGGKWSLHHRVEGTFEGVDVSVLLVQFGVMADPESYECRTCGARLGISGGFVTDGEADGYFEAEVARHQDGICFGAAGVA